MMTTQQSDWIRLAAYIDGEGTIAVKNLTTKSGRYSQLIVAIANTDPRLPMWCKENFGGLLYASDNNTKKSAKWRRYFRWIAHSAHAESIVRQCLPYFLLKREQAEVALAYRETFHFRVRRGLGRGKGVAQMLSDADIALRQHYRDELHRLKREIPEDAFVGAPLPANPKNLIQ
jgi:hypothetical protein